MFRLSQKADYAMILLASLKTANGSLSISKIAQKYKISQKFLSQIALDLKKAGILASKEGISGGYFLATEPDKIKVLDVVNALDGGVVKGECLEEDHDCRCGGKEIWMEMKKQVEAALGSKTVADLGGS